MAFITVAGENQIAAKQGAGQTLNITSFVLAYIAGLGSEPANRIEAMPAAGNIKATLPVTQSGYVNTNQVVYSLVMDSSLGDYDFNWVGLVDDAGVLIAVTYTPTIQKRKTAGAVPGNNLTRNFLIAFSGIQATTAIAVPAETWQIDFNARLWGIDERERLSNYDIYGHEGFFGDGWKVTRQGATTTYDVAAGIGYVGGVRIASAVTQQVTVSGPPKSVWLDVSLQGDISDVSAVVSFTIDAVLHYDYTDANGFDHYVTKIADIAADGSVTDVRVNAEFIDTPPLGDNDKSPVNSEWVQQTIGKVLTKSVAGNSNVTLTAVEAGHGLLKFTGTLTGNISVIVPTSPTRSWLVVNATSGAFTLTVKTAAGTGIIVGQSKTANLYTDGTNVLSSGTNGLYMGKGVQRFTGNGTFTVPADVTTIYVSGCAGGGGGGAGGGAGGSFYGAGGGGGGAGQSTIRQAFAVTPGQSVAITIGGAGSGGAGNSSGGAAATSGGSTVIGSLVTLTGGGGGGNGTNATANIAGGVGGTGSPRGSCGIDTVPNTSGGNGGTGASCAFGGGGGSGRGAANTDGVSGFDAYGYGSGGGGGGGVYTQSATKNGGNGGNGAPGLVIIEW